VFVENSLYRLGIAEQQSPHPELSLVGGINWRKTDVPVEQDRAKHRKTEQRQCDVFPGPKTGWNFDYVRSKVTFYQKNAFE
jgi:hypothetical protein